MNKDDDEADRMQELLDRLGVLETMILPQDDSDEECAAKDGETVRSSSIPLLLAVTGLPYPLFLTDQDQDDPYYHRRDEMRDQFESVFKSIDAGCSFAYLRSFRRVHVTMTSEMNALLARMQLHEQTVCGVAINIYFAQWARIPVGNDSLQLPKPYKLFLISPPASPPVDWEQTVEAEPVISYDLLSALTTLAPGEHTLHPGCTQLDHPSIVVTTCEDNEDNFDEPQINGSISKPKIIQTRCPDRRITH